MIDQRFSCTSNTVKLFKHLDTLSGIQQGKVIPIMVHMMPTHRCQMDCAYCCFKNRKDKRLDMPFEVLESGVRQFRDLGTKAIELTGGGDPTLYPRINDVMTLLHNIGYHIGINTNAVDSQLIENWEYCDWVRVSMNTLDACDAMNIGPLRNRGAYISACYIWHERSTLAILQKVADFCKMEKIVCRIAPDCIKPLEFINESVAFLKALLETEFYDNEFLFLSDFNITTERHGSDCLIHMIKPCFYTDGYVYPCPSSELAQENDFQMQHEFAICRWDRIFQFYTSKRAIYPVHRECSYCKYEKQEIVLEELLAETTFNEFA